MDLVLIGIELKLLDVLSFLNRQMPGTRDQTEGASSKQGLQMRAPGAIHLQGPEVGSPEVEPRDIPVQKIE